LQNYEGVYQGYVTDLAKVYLDSLSADDLAQVEVYSCGPHPMLEAVAKLAKEYNLPCQVSLEEYMGLCSRRLCGLRGRSADRCWTSNETCLC
jgi:dihydroorotate oxidase B, electron transfer subunit (EC 1.3.3.1)